jgi:dihydrofolate reductase
MSKLRVSCFSLSLDGYGAGPDQSLEHPLGVGGERLHDWFVPTNSFQKSHGHGMGTTGPDDDFAARMTENVGAWIMGRNMFGPVRREWPDESWKGWWGDEPPFHADVFVLTHHARKSFPMKGGTTFHFVTDGIQLALTRARSAAKDKDVLLSGGTATIRQFVQAGLVDEMHLAVSPIVLGSGEHLFSGLDLPALGFTLVDYLGTENAAHYVLTRK